MQNEEDEAKVVKMERIEERECQPSVTDYWMTISLLISHFSGRSELGGCLSKS